MSLEIALTHRVGDLAISVDVSAPGGVVALFGPSGAGKTTIVNAVAGLTRPAKGRIAIGGEVLFDSATGTDLPRYRRGIGYVFQDARLFPHMTVARNIAFGQRFAGGRSGGPETGDVVNLLGIGHLMDRRPAGLSGGEAQRVAIARALLARPRLLLLDEPLASLDAARREEILPYLERVRDEMRVPMLYVSHSVAEVARLATIVVLIEAGRVRMTGPPEQVLADPQAGLGAWSGEGGALLTARISEHHPEDGLSELAHTAGPLFVPLVDRSPGEAVRVRVSASDVMIARSRPEGLSALNMLTATVESVTPLDPAAAAVSLRVGDDALLARITGRSARELGLEPGLSCFAVVKSMRVAAADLSTV